jgi:hypothetical protein
MEFLLKHLWIKVDKKPLEIWSKKGENIWKFDFIILNNEKEWYKNWCELAKIYSKKKKKNPKEGG